MVSFNIHIVCIMPFSDVMKHMLTEVNTSPYISSMLAGPVYAMPDKPWLWSIAFSNGVNARLFITWGFPYYYPQVKFYNFEDPGDAVKTLCEEPIAAGDMERIIETMYFETHTALARRKRILIGKGILRCAPMLMLWRKRATERLYHPSRIDFAAEVRELNALSSL